MTRTVFGWLALPVVLAACGSPQSSSSGNTAATAAENYAAQMEALPPQQLSGTLFRAIRDAGRDCQQVTSAQRQRDVEGRPAWTAVCDERTTWLVVLGADGVATVTSAGGAPGTRKG